MPVTTTDTIGSARDFWTKIAQLDYVDFRDDATDLRKAFHAAATLYHVVDWVWGDYKSRPQMVYGAGSLNDLRDHIIQNECANFGLIRDVADSTKHFRLDRSSATVSSATEVTSRSTGYGEGGYGEGGYGGAPQVVVGIPNGIRHFTAIAKNVHDMWDRLFREKGW